MEPVTEPGIDLFADDLPSMDEIQTLSEFIHSGEANMISFNEQVESNMSKTGQKASLTTGIGLFILGRYAEAAKKDDSGSDVVGAETDTDKDGRFQFSNMAEKQYHLYSGYIDIKGNMKSRTVTGGQEEEITLRVDLSEWSKLEPRKPDENE